MTFAFPFFNGSIVMLTDSRFLVCATPPGICNRSPLNCACIRFVWSDGVHVAWI